MSKGGSPMLIALGFFFFGLMSGFSMSRIGDAGQSSCDNIQNSNNVRSRSDDSNANLKNIMAEIKEIKNRKSQTDTFDSVPKVIQSDKEDGNNNNNKIHLENVATIKELQEKLNSCLELATSTIKELPPPPSSSMTQAASTSASTSSSTIAVTNNILTFAAPLVVRDVAKVDANGFIIAAGASKITHFSLDVGFNKGRVTVNDWLEKQQNLFVICVEAIPALFTLFETMMASETQIGDGGSGAGDGDTVVPYWKLTKFHASQRALVYKKFCHDEKRCMMINGAVSSTPGVAEFNTGVGRDANGQGATDTGSLFAFRNGGARERAKKWSATLVRKFRLDELLKFIPIPTDKYSWDTFKVDIQGGDVDALVSAGKYLKYFTCVIGEFDVGSYQIPNGVQTNPTPILLAAGFINTNIVGRSVWINPKYKNQYLADPESFGCHRVHDVPASLNRLIAAFKKL